MSKHTPGPWRHRHNDRGTGFYVCAADGRELAVVNERLCDISNQEAEANAKLFAASPNLLAYVREVVADLDASQRFADMRPEYEDMLKRGLELLARVDGESK